MKNLKFIWEKKYLLSQLDTLNINVQFQNVTLIMGGGFMLTSFAVQIQVAWASRFVGGLASEPDLEGIIQKKSVLARTPWNQNPGS